MNVQQHTMDIVAINGEDWCVINNVDDMPPFLMSIVSDTDLWMFIASNGGLTCGRKNAAHALFPYYTDDKLVDSITHTGSKTIVRISQNGLTTLWEPFCTGLPIAGAERNLYKSVHGNKIIFEEKYQEAGLVYRMEWNSSNQYGWIRKTSLHNTSAVKVAVDVLDGLINIMPAGVPSAVQNNTSNLVNAYKRSELHTDTGLAMYALSAIIADKPEPSEALKANVVWSAGFHDPLYLLSTAQIKSFQQNQPLFPETDVKGERGAYILTSKMLLQPGETKEWIIAADVNKNHAAVNMLLHELRDAAALIQKVTTDISAGTQQLVQLVAAADGLQLTADSLQDVRHYSNVLFNIMRGGIFDDQYSINKKHLLRYVQQVSRVCYTGIKEKINELPENFGYFTLIESAVQLQNKDAERILSQYLPLKFSRRHGDPSRPWNKFSINITDEITGEKIQDYEGNWRDIFQNWEALAYAYPAFTGAMITKFLNASTFDGYNPYRLTLDGFDWETIEPDDPWSYIGYWGDHQVIYLLKLLEWYRKCLPQSFTTLIQQENFVYANVPYVIKPYSEIVQNPKDTIVFDHTADQQLKKAIVAEGMDAALKKDQQGQIHHVHFTEKILAQVLAKLVNFILGGGIWMNTQRPEWNDANNALVGYGVSVVTACYLYRMLQFLIATYENDKALASTISTELYDCLVAVDDIFKQHTHLLKKAITPAERKQFMDAMGNAGSAYRQNIYNNNFSGKKEAVQYDQLVDFFILANQYLEHTIIQAQRKDALFHSYNIITYDDRQVQVKHLSEMLEGQVAVLSTGILNSAACCRLLDALRQSKLYREDVQSYLLYPDKSLPGFLQKNNIPQAAVQQCALLRQMLQHDDRSIVEKDVAGVVHFNSNFNNANDVKKALEQLDTTIYPNWQKCQQQVLDIFENLFNHQEFTGRSGTFFGYEGLGSVYWHMVSKLLLAIIENCHTSIHENREATLQLLNHYYSIKEGLGLHKTPQQYGTFTVDPCSHTPMHKGAQQPGMTGQVKEDIICRMIELGITADKGLLYLDPYLLRKKEFNTTPATMELITVHGDASIIPLKENALGFTICQVPVCYQVNENEMLQVQYSNGNIVTQKALQLSYEESQAVFNRTGSIQSITVQIHPQRLV